LSFDDLWPLEHSAVAVASRAGRSSVLLYEDSSWKVIHEVPFLLASVWASAEGVWVSGDDGYVAHGHREGNGWAWNVHPLAVSKRVSVIWGAAPHDVYALADARVWRLVLGADAGVPDAGWRVDYGGISAPDPEVTLTGLVGRSEDDIWVTGARESFTTCGLVLHKTRNGWESVVEATPVLPPEPFDPPTCEASGNAIAFGGAFGKGTATATGELVAITKVGFTAPASFARLRHAPNGGAELTLAPRSTDVTSLWGVSADDLYASSFSVVERGRDVWADGGGWHVSTVAFEGIALVKPFHVVRGTRSDNVWLAGESYVFHKTSP
ncbi:MAG: hypothetical protein K0S65_3850, partial [Labilithrix sp.]|nr:hypothetical protein [Labilithrix sp.]